MNEINRDKILDALKYNYEESIFITDGEGNVVFANRLAAERLNCDLEKIEGKNVRELLGERIYDYSTVLDALEKKETVVGMISENVFSNSVPILDDNGKVTMVVTNNTNVKKNNEWMDIIKAQQESQKLRRELDYIKLQDKKKIIAYSPVMERVLETVEFIAPADSSVVVLGESGTGKDLIAKLIHEKSNRAKSPYLSINCAAMPETLLESELFGYEAGAFTGAKSGGKIGLFEATDGGTMFLDEIGEMSLSLQSKLLRVLENHDIRRIGGVKNIPVDVRVICATNKDLAEMVEQKTFREDLYYRLGVFTIKLPPLSERKEDIIPIAQMYLDELNKKYNTNKVLADVTKETMLGYEWPGNIRELRNVMERIYIISQNNQLIFTPIPTAKYGTEEGEEGFYGNGISGYSTLKEFVAAQEKKYIEAMLETCNGSVSQTANKLGIHRSVLYRKLKKETK